MTVPEERLEMLTLKMADDQFKVYLDWNIFNKIERLDHLDKDDHTNYRLIEQLIEQKMFVVPYSNAHINDLLRGYLKDPSYTPGHLLNLKKLTGNLCITQYWGEKNVRWHYREPSEYLLSVDEESLDEAESFSALFDITEDPFAIAVFALKKASLRSTPVPEDFKKIYSLNPIFSSIYPRTRTEMNMLALCEDIYAFSFRIKKDYTLYKNFRKFLLETKMKYPQYKDLITNADKNLSSPAYLTWDALWDNLPLDKVVSANIAYDKILNLFTTTDLKGYRQDEKFANLIDDGLHCFYAAHCDFFITIDQKCYDKAKLVYQKLKIQTTVLTPNEFRGFAKTRGWSNDL